jgi:hypothetical protein
MTFATRSAKASTPPPTPLIGSSRERSVKGNSNPVRSLVTERS